ncbi:hypothetical protein [Maribacter sp. 2210JD10-5]|uniref:hypothetical protein n=1 Tax=Maribacter sp. 2210JD10-5 TaxID=3386272 RepID=UPI0039BC89D8
MQKLTFFLLFVSVFIGCKDKTSAEAKLQDTGEVMELSKLPKLVSVNSEARAILSDWPEYKAFELSFKGIYDAEFREDLVLVIEDLVEKQKTWEASDYPAKFDVPQVKGRQKVLKTFILKTKGNLEYRQDPRASLKEAITAFNALLEQFNITLNYVLPEELLSDKN